MTKILTEPVAHLAALGMIVLPTVAVSVQSISTVRVLDSDNLMIDLSLINGELVNLRGADATEFIAQSQNLVRQIMFQTARVKPA